MLNHVQYSSSSSLSQDGVNNGFLSGFIAYCDLSDFNTRIPGYDIWM